MTRAGIVMQLYGEEIERRPFSRFTADTSERAANSDWRERAMAWAETRVNKYGYYDEPTEQKKWYYGKVFYASQKAKQDKLIKENRKTTISSYYSVRYLSANFVEINLDSSGQSYVHMQLAE